jgi:type IV fimbrial biogenesis protein FimT
MFKTNQLGFTLWELLMTLLVAGVLFGIGVPNVMEFQRNGAMAAVANDVVTGVLMARAQAVSRQVPVTLCLSDDPTAVLPTCDPDAVVDSPTHGLIVWVDESGPPLANGSPDLTTASDGDAVVDAAEEILFRSVPRGAPVQLSANCGYIAFGPNGWPRQVPGECFQPGNGHFLVYCDDRGRRAAAGGLSSARAIRVAPTGRADVLQEIAAVNPALAETLADCP